MCLGKDTKKETFIFSNSIFNNSNKEKTLGIPIDNKLTLKFALKCCVEKPLRNQGLYKAIKSSKRFSEKINFQFHNKITI